MKTTRETVDELKINFRTEDEQRGRSLHSIEMGVVFQCVQEIKEALEMYAEIDKLDYLTKETSKAYSVLKKHGFLEEK